MQCSAGVLPPGVKYQWPVVGELTPPKAPEPEPFIESRDLVMARAVPEPEPRLRKNEWDCTAESENQAREYKQQSAKLSDRLSRDNRYSLFWLQSKSLNCYSLIIISFRIMIHHRHTYLNVKRIYMSFISKNDDDEDVHFVT